MASIQTIRAELDTIESTGALNGKPSQWGPPIWRVLEQTVRIIPCGHCRVEGELMIDALHDMVNIYKGDPPERPKALCELAKQAMLATARAKVCRIIPLKKRAQPEFD